jgi:hypothetical protein
MDDQVEHLLHARAAADDAGELVILRLQVLAQRRVLGEQSLALDGVAQHDQHFVVLERLGDVVEGAALHRGNGVLHRRKRRDHEHRQVFIDLLQLVERLHPVHSGHHHVDDRGIEWQRLGQLETLGRRRREPDVVTLARQERLEDLPHDLFVVDDQDGTVAAHISLTLQLACGGGVAHVRTLRPPVVRCISALTCITHTSEVTGVIPRRASCRPHRAQRARSRGPVENRVRTASRRPCRSRS